MSADFLVLLALPISSYLPEGLSRHGVKPAAPCQLWPQGDSDSGGAPAPSLQTETKPGFIRVCFMLCWGVLIGYGI
jgi:hypothetical protein